LYFIYFFLFQAPVDESYGSLPTINEAIAPLPSDKVAKTTKKPTTTTKKPTATTKTTTTTTTTTTRRRGMRNEQGEIGGFLLKSIYSHTCVQSPKIVTVVDRWLWFTGRVVSTH
jgi:hypothetical protein